MDTVNLPRCSTSMIVFFFFRGLAVSGNAVAIHLVLVMVFSSNGYINL